MKRKTKRALSMVLASSMMLSVSSYTAFGASFRDTDGHWAANQVNIWSDYGVINGYDGLFRPDDSITRGEMAVIMDKVMKYQVAAENTFGDLDQNFYTDSILKANQAGIMRGSDGAVRPKDNITREEASVLICQAFAIDPIEGAVSKFNDGDKVSSWAAGYVNALSQKGYISGKGDNNFDPKGNITRGEAVTMFNNIVKGFYHQAGTYTQNITGNVVVNTPDTTLKDMSVTGDIFITEGVADGDLTLENVVATNVVVRGGGVNSIKILGNSKIGNVRVDKKDGAVRVATDGVAKVDSIYVSENSKTSTLEGNLGKVEVASTDSTVRITNATVKELNVTQQSAKVIIDEKSKVEKVTVAETAVNASVEINGIVINLDVNAANSSISTGPNSKVENLTVSEKATNAKLDIGGIVTNLTTAAQSTIMNIAQKAVVSTLKIFEKATNSALTVAGKVNSILVDAANAIIEVLKGGEIGTIESSSTAVNLEVKGEGKVNEIKIGGNNSKVTISNTHVIVKSEVTGTLVNGNEVDGGQDVTTGSGSDITPGEVVNPGGTQTVDPNDPDDPSNYDDDGDEEQAAPTGIDGVRPTTLANTDGMLKNTTTDMEYKLSTDSTYTECSDDETPVPAPGTYDVRLKASEGKLASPNTPVEVKAFDISEVKVQQLPKNIESLHMDDDLALSEVYIQVKFDTEKDELKEKTYNLSELDEQKNNPEYPKYKIENFSTKDHTSGKNVKATIAVTGYDNTSNASFEYRVLNREATITEINVPDAKSINGKEGTSILNPSASEPISIVLNIGTVITDSEATFEVSPGAKVKVDGVEQTLDSDNKFTIKLNESLTIEVTSEDETVGPNTYTITTGIEEESYGFLSKKDDGGNPIVYVVNQNGVVYEGMVKVYYWNGVWNTYPSWNQPGEGLADPFEDLVSTFSSTKCFIAFDEEAINELETNINVDNDGPDISNEYYEPNSKNISKVNFN